MKTVSVLYPRNICVAIYHLLDAEIQCQVEDTCKQPTPLPLIPYKSLSHMLDGDIFKKRAYAYARYLYHGRKALQ